MFADDMEYQKHRLTAYEKAIVGAMFNKYRYKLTENI